MLNMIMHLNVLSESLYWKISSWYRANRFLEYIEWYSEKMIVIQSLCICMNKKSWKWPGNESCFLTIHPCINTISLGRINIIWFWHLFHWCGKFTYFECFHTGSIEILTFGSWMYKTDILYKPSIFIWIFFILYENSYSKV